MKPNDRLIVALDVDTIQQAQVIIHKLDGLVNTYKVGWRLFMAEGMHVIHTLNYFCHNIFLDLKLIDIPSTITHALYNMPYLPHVKFLTCMGNEETICAACKGISKNNPHIKLLYVTRLSTDTETTGTSIRKINTMIYNGLSGIITSGDLIKYYRNNFNKDELTIIVPGVRLTNVNLFDEHKNTNTVESAFEQGADYIVVGRPIINADDVVDATNKFIKKISI